MQQLAEHGPCFVCGTANPHNLHVIWYAETESRVSTHVTLSATQQGPPGFAHGGASAVLLDKVMGAAVWHSGRKVAATSYQVVPHDEERA